MTSGPLQWFINDSSINVYVESWVSMQVGCREQMRFQFSFEGLSVCSSFNFYWQLIPDACCSGREGTFAELQSHPPGNMVIVAYRAVRSSARYRRCRFNQVLDVGVLMVWWTGVRQAGLEFNPLLNLCQWRDLSADVTWSLGERPHTSRAAACITALQWCECWCR